MNKTEFMDLLRYYFRHISEADLTEILQDYEAHFREGQKRGLSEEEIAKELGSPKAIYDMYLHEGMLNEKESPEPRSEAKEKLPSAAGKFAKGTEELTGSAKKAWDTAISPRLPDAAGTVSRLTLQCLTYACFAAGFLIILLTALAVYFLSGTFPALGGMPPLPGLSPLTLASLFGTGFFAGLSLFFVGLELQKSLRRFLPPGNPSSGTAPSLRAKEEDRLGKTDITMKEPLPALGK